MNCKRDLDDLGNLARSAYTSYFMKTIHYVPLECPPPGVPPLEVLQPVGCVELAMTHRSASRCYIARGRFSVTAIHPNDRWSITSSTKPPSGIISSTE